MTSDLDARLHAHGILVVGDVEEPAAEAHARLREALRRRYPSGLRLLRVLAPRGAGRAALQRRRRRRAPSAQHAEEPQLARGALVVGEEDARARDQVLDGRGLATPSAGAATWARPRRPRRAPAR